MQQITFVSTVHKEIGKCNADELYSIIKDLGPEVVFLEALEDTYSAYDRRRFSEFEVHHKKLEIKAIQKYRSHAPFRYIPVLDKGLADAFDNKYNVVCEDVSFQNLIDHFNALAGVQGFPFLNSAECIRLHEEMRMLANDLLGDSEPNKAANEYIDSYENTMIRNIHSYCSDNQFNSAIFMCGSAHRKSIIEKVKKLTTPEETNVNWVIFGS